MTQIPDRQEQLEALVRTEHHGTRESKPQRSVGDRSRSANRGRSTLSDEGVIRRCRRSKDSERFASLFDRGETHAYGHDHSRADLALISILSGSTRDAEQLDRLFRRSELCRKKWTEREDYRRLTIERALARPPTKPGPSQEVREALEALEAEMWSKPWRGKAAQSQWKIMHALIAAAMEHGEMIPAGVRVGISRRQIAEDAGISDTTAKKQIKALRQRGELRGDNLDRKPDDAGALVILFPGDCRPDHGATAEPGDGDSAKPPHPSTGGGVTTEFASGSDLRSMRSSVAGVKRLGPSAGRAIEALLRCGGEATLKELRNLLGMRYPSDVKRVLARAKEYGVVVLEGDRVRLSEGWQEMLEEGRRAGLEYLSGEVQAAYHRLERQRRAHGRDANDLSAKRLRRARQEHEATRDQYSAARRRRETEGREDRA